MAEKKTCFVVGPIGEAGTEVRQKADWLLKGIIRPVLEAEDLGYKVKRADDDADPGSITSALITDVINSDLVIADLTGFNPNAFYELGIRHAVQKPTIHIIAELVRLPFDNTDQRTIFVDISNYDSVEGAKKQLHAAASAINAEGYRVTNPVTKAGGISDLEQSHDPKDKILRDLVKKVEALENRSVDTNITGQGSFANLTQKEAERAIIAAVYPKEITLRDRMSGNSRQVELFEAANRLRTPKNYTSYLTPEELQKLLEGKLNDADASGEG